MRRRTLAVHSKRDAKKYGKKISEEIQELRREIKELSNYTCYSKSSSRTEEGHIKRHDEDGRELTFKVKLCNAMDCIYVEKKTCNNMNYHFVLYHIDLEYSSKPFDETEMNNKDYKKLKHL